MNFLEIIGLMTIVCSTITAFYVIRLITCDEKELALNRREKQKVYTEEYNGPYYIRFKLYDRSDVVMKIERDTVDIFGPNSFYNEKGFLQYIIMKFELEYEYRENISMISLDSGLKAYFNIYGEISHNGIVCQHN